MEKCHFSIQQLHPSIRSTARSLLPFWINEGWYEEKEEKFICEKVIDIIQSIPQIESQENVELLDLYYSTLDVLLRSNKNFKNEIKVDSHSFFGASGFRYQLKNLDNDLVNIVSLSIGHYLNNDAQDSIDHIRKLFFLKNATEVLSSLDFKVKLDKNLSSREVAEVVKAEPIFEELFDNGKPFYNLNYRLLLSDNTQIDVMDSDFFGDRKYLEKNKKYIILSDDIYSAIEKQRKSKQLSEREFSSFVIKPTVELFPQGTDLSKFDLGEYDKRVSSFEIKKKSKFSEVTSMGIEWYKKDDVGVPIYRIRNIDGTYETIALEKNIINSILAKANAALSSGVVTANNEPLPIELDNGNFLYINRENIEELSSLAKTINGNNANKKSKDKEETSGTTTVAVLQTIHQEIVDKPFPEICLTNADLVPYLREEFTLKKHQLDGVNWLVNSYFSGRGGVILADDMGLGKTLQLALFIVLMKNAHRIPQFKNYLHKNSSRTLSMVVAPLILLENWKDEFSKFIREDHCPDVLILHGNILKTITSFNGSLNGDWWSHYDVVIANYNTFSKFQIDLLKIKFLVNIFDESQNIKNPDTAQTRAARGLNTSFAICATGTPIENRLLDLWSQVDTLNRKPTNPFGEIKDFVNNFEKNSNGNEKTKEVMKLGENDALMLRRDKELLRNLKELKDKINMDPVYVEMSDFQKHHEALIVQKYKSKPLQVLQFLQKLYQHPVLLNDNIDEEIPLEQLINDSPKLKATIEILDEIQKKGEKVLVFTLWVKMQAILQRVFKEKYGIDISIINGDTDKSANAINSAKDLIKKFGEKHGFNILILSPLAAGAGLNIVAANHVIHYGRWWNPAKEDQGTDRAYRIGQNKEVYVYYPILKNTSSDGEISGFDYKLHNEVIRRKRALANDVLTPVNDLDIKDFDFEGDKDE